MKSSLRK
jgi:hypothetical protein